MESAKNYTIWRRRHAAAATPDINKGLLDLPGVEVVGASPDRAEVRMDPDAVRQLQDKLGPGFLIEEVRPRRPADD